MKLGGGRVTAQERKSLVRSALTHEQDDQMHRAFGSAVCRSAWLVLMGHSATAIKRAKPRSASKLLDGRTLASGRKVISIHNFIILLN